MAPSERDDVPEGVPLLLPREDRVPAGTREGELEAQGEEDAEGHTEREGNVVGDGEEEPPLATPTASRCPWACPSPRRLGRRCRCPHPWACPQALR